MQEAVLNVVKTVNVYLSDYILIVLLIGAGLFFSIKTKFVQVRCFGEGMKKVFGNIKLFGGKQSGGLSSFQALATAIAAQVGTGNIVGASGAILMGGPGAIFWMWIIAFLGMATIYAEAVLAQITRKVDPDGTVHGGPVYYIKTAFKGTFGKFLAGFFAVAITLALGFMGAMVQSNSIATNFNTAIPAIPMWAIGLVVTVAAAFIFLGGINRIASVTEKLVPIMAVLFLIGGFIIIGFRINYIPETFAMIFKYAFTPNALLGGAAGAAIKAAVSYGAKRGLFSNEAGMGSTPHAHAMAKVEKPHDQGVVAMIGVFIDTFIVLTMTAIVVISTLYTKGGMLCNVTGEAYQGAIGNIPGVDAIVSSGDAMQNAFKIALPENLEQIGVIFIAVCLLFFAFSTIISWNFFGKINIQYLFKSEKKLFKLPFSLNKNSDNTVTVKKLAIFLYSLIAIGFIFLGSLLESKLVWELTDFFNYLMVLPNVLALIALSSLVSDAAKKNKEKKKK